MAQVVCAPLYVVHAQTQSLVQVEDVVVAWHRGAFEPLVCDQKEIQMARGSDALGGHGACWQTLGRLATLRALLALVPLPTSFSPSNILSSQRHRTCTPRRSHDGPMWKPPPREPHGRIHPLQLCAARALHVLLLVATQGLVDALVSAVRNLKIIPHVVVVTEHLCEVCMHSLAFSGAALGV